MTEQDRPKPEWVRCDAVARAIAMADGKQSILADRLACAQQTVSKLLSGEISMTADWALRLSAATDGAIPPGEFYEPLATLLSAPTSAQVPA